MSSTGSVLQNERPKRPGEFTFTWSIHNYSYCTRQENMYINSPDFMVEFFGDVKLWLEFYPRGNNAPGFASCYLRGRGGVESCNFTLGIRMSNGQFKEGEENLFCPTMNKKGYSNMICLEELKGPNGCIVNDTLTIRCRIWETDANNPASLNWEAHSRIKVSKLDYTWILNGISVSNDVFENEFNKSIDITEYFTEETEINLQVLKKGGLSEEAIQFCIGLIKPKKTCLWIVVVHVIDANGRIAHSSRCEHLFETSNTMLDWKFPLISKEKLYKNKKMYLPNNQLTLRCELSFANVYRLETFVFRTTNEHELESTTIDQQLYLQEKWIENMQQCYEDGKFSDFIIRTPNRQFPVSRTILSAHSEVFDAMFKRDMKERKTGMVDIEDLDDDTVSKMLTYVYTSTLNVIDCNSAQKLYFAADKYGIAVLQAKCSIYLIGCFDVSNICDILELADRHEDQELKSCARDFFYVHAKEIMSSESWKKLRESNSPLTSETMEWMVCNKFLM